MQNSIRLRLTAWYVMALALTLVLLGGATFLSTRASLYHWVDEILEQRAEALSEEVRLVTGRPQLDLPEQLHGGYEGIGDGFLILDGSRTVVLARGLDAGRFGAASAVTVGLTGWPATGTVSTVEEVRPEEASTEGPPGQGRRPWRVASHPILSDGRVAAVVLVGHDLEEVDEVLQRLAIVLTALLPLALLGAGAGGLALAGRALAPVDQITRTAAEISERDLSRRLPVGPGTREAGGDELGRLATTFNALIERLQRAFERQRRFTADASHELRTPLSIIRAVTSQQLMQRRKPEEYERALHQIDEAAAYMGKLVGHLLTLARADAGQAPLEQEGVNLAELLEHVAGQVAEASGRVIPIQADETVWVVGDTMRLMELFLNLLENAVKYTPRDGSVEVQIRQHHGQAHVIVRDTGVGIPPEHLPHIFDRFYRVDNARARDEGGTGLGLAIGRWIAEAHGGRILATSEPGRGTTMTVTLPEADPPVG